MQWDLQERLIYFLQNNYSWADVDQCSGQQIYLLAKGVEVKA